MFNHAEIQEIIEKSSKEQWPYFTTFIALRRAGVESYEVDVASHTSLYVGQGDCLRENVGNLNVSLTINPVFCGNAVKNAILTHQAKKTTYSEFLQDIATSGVVKYIVNMKSKVITYYGRNSEKYEEKIPVDSNMSLNEAALFCEEAWSEYAKKNNIKRDDAFYLFKMQEELGELTRSFMELRGSESTHYSLEFLKNKFEKDCASLVGNALILAQHFQVDIEIKLKEKFQLGSMIFD